ncbi:unnamed protein product [Rotaria socialis]|uniref:Uncharacterized protein n=1 Tax=Rotaria socialis TaxID=392032 RepID=A0A817QFL7_9BILA|nr:unnamed protein product [Rotaria socialis]CAF4448633.1 unnamed protein product [Rotaria socialis]
MGSRSSRNAQPGLAGYGEGPDPNYGMDYYGGAYEPSGLTYGGYPTAGYSGGSGYGGAYPPTSFGAGVNPYGSLGGPLSANNAYPIGSLGGPAALGGSNALGLGGMSGLPPKVRVIFVPQGGASQFAPQMQMPMPQMSMPQMCAPQMPMPMPMPMPPEYPAVGYPPSKENFML